MKNNFTRSKYRRSLVLRSASASESPHFSDVTRDTFSPELFQQAFLYIAAEDEAFIAFNKEIYVCSLLNVRKNVCVSSCTQDWESVDGIPLARRKIFEWLNELDTLTKEVEAELVSREIGCHLVEVWMQ